MDAFPSKEKGLGVNVLALLLMTAVWGAEMKQPYIDQLKAEMAGKETGSAQAVGATPYLDRIRADAEAREARLAPEDRPATGSYIEKLKQEDPQKAALPSDQLGTSQASWLEQEKARLGNEERISPIEDMATGKSRKKAKLEDKPSKNAFGLRLNAYAIRDFTAQNSTRPFSQVYSASWYPELVLFYERQFLSSESWGSLGLSVTSGFGMFQGIGIFEHNLLKPWDPSDRFGTTSQTSLTFVSIPLFVGGIYRMNFLKYVRPYGQAQVGGVGAIETRNDGLGTKLSYGAALSASGGANILLNWIDPNSSAELLDTLGATRYYLTADFTAQIPLFGLIRYTNMVFSAGMTYEF